MKKKPDPRQLNFKSYVALSPAEREKARLQNLRDVQAGRAQRSRLAEPEEIKAAVSDQYEAPKPDRTARFSIVPQVRKSEFRETLERKNGEKFEH